MIIAESRRSVGGMRNKIPVSRDASGQVILSEHDDDEADEDDNEELRRLNTRA